MYEVRWINDEDHNGAANNHCWLSSDTALQTVDTFSLYTANVGHKTSYTIKSTRKEQTTRKKKKNGTAAAAEYTFNDL